MTQSKVLTVGQAISALDIFLSANGSPVSGKFVGFRLLDAANIQVVSGIALNPSLGTYTGSGIIPAGFQLGDWQVNWTIITAGDGLQFATELFTVQDVEVSIGFQPTTDETETIYDAVRIDVGDTDNRFDDDFLKRVLIKAIRRLNRELGFNHQFCCGSRWGRHSCCHIGPIAVNLDTGDITPNDNDLLDLLILQIEFILLTAELSALKRLQASGPFGSTIKGDGISVVNADGVQISVSPSRLSFRSDLHKFDVQQRQKELEDAIKLYKYQKSACFAKFIWG